MAYTKFDCKFKYFSVIIESVNMKRIGRLNVAYWITSELLCFSCISFARCVKQSDNAFFAFVIGINTTFCS